MQKVLSKEDAAKVRRILQKQFKKQIPEYKRINKHVVRRRKK